MIKISKILFIIILSCALVACSSTSNTSTQQTSNNPSSNENVEKEESKEAENDKEVFTLKASTHSPPGALTDTFDAFLDEIEKRTDGQIQFERYYLGTLASGFDVVDAITSGVADVALVFSAWQSGRISLATVTDNTALYSDTWAASKTLDELYDTIPELNEELDKLGIVNIGNFALTPTHLLSTKTINSFEDLKGLRVITNSRPASTLSQELGMTPLAIPLPESYEALTRGLADAIIFGFQGSQTYGLFEMTTHAWKLPLNGTSGFFGISKQTWESLPIELQEIIEEIKYDFVAKNFYEVYQMVGEKSAEEAFLAEGGTLVDITAEDLKKIEDISSEYIWSTWVKEQEDKGLPGQLVLDKFRELYEKYEQENPFK